MYSIGFCGLDSFVYFTHFLRLLRYKRIQTHVWKLEKLLSKKKKEQATLKIHFECNQNKREREWREREREKAKEIMRKSEWFCRIILFVLNFLLIAFALLRILVHYYSDFFLFYCHHIFSVMLLKSVKSWFLLVRLTETKQWIFTWTHISPFFLLHLHLHLTMVSFFILLRLFENCIQELCAVQWIWFNYDYI